MPIMLTPAASLASLWLAVAALVLTCRVADAGGSLPRGHPLRVVKDAPADSFYHMARVFDDALPAPLFQVLEPEGLAFETR